MEGVEEQKEKTEGENEISVSATEKKMDNAAVAASEEKKEEEEEEEEEEDTKKNGKKRKAQDKDILDNRLDYQKHKCDELKAQLKKLENGTLTFSRTPHPYPRSRVPLSLSGDLVSRRPHLHYSHPHIFQEPRRIF